MSSMLHIPTYLHARTLDSSTRNGVGVAVARKRLPINYSFPEDQSELSRVWFVGLRC